MSHIEIFLEHRYSRIELLTQMSKGLFEEVLNESSAV